MTPARYSVSMGNKLSLKKHTGSKINVATLDTTANFDAACRMIRPIQASDGMMIPQYIQKAFNDELKFADVYGDSGIHPDGELSKIALSSSSGLTSG